jgi:hypothetical protein
MLVYLPLTAFMDKTQLHFLFGADSLRKFVDEVGSHETFIHTIGGTGLSLAQLRALSQGSVAPQNF